MSVLLKLIKVSPTVLTTGLVCLPHRAIRTTPTLLWFNKKYTRLSSSTNREQRYMEKDGVPASSQLIYRAPMESYVVWAMHVSTATSVLISSAALYNYTVNEPVTDAALTAAVENVTRVLVAHPDDIYYFAVGFLAINLLMRFVVSVFPQRIYKDNGKYLVVFHPQWPGGVSHHRFNQGEVKDVNYKLSPWNNATYKLGNKTALLFVDYFKTPSEFYEMSEEYM